ncbi:Sec20-domain-containing protein [Halteromyces radiatus]|uniref:Sec20-domain-containing protein n=1 Tax=Halteromyces radiatus TaxID=101107 RepID=UPI00221FD80A|nr:Sec20-domain-containing protein [Halteromyces radiatus]KAI8092827.1 Sec20-domain-containing protein [Halteromyces radiatus]
MDAKFRSLSKQAADCQRHIYKLNNVDSLTVQEEVASLLKSDIRQLEQNIQQVKLLADEQDRQSSKNDILNRLGEYEIQHRQLQITARQAILKSKQRIQKKEQETREALFGRKKDDFNEEYELRNRGKDDSLLRATTNVTEALQRTSTLMQQELEKSSYSASILADSSRTLSATFTEYENLDSLLTISKRMITHLETSDWFDRLLLLFGVAVFCLVVLYIIKKRTYDVGKSWFSWIGSSIISSHSSSSSSSSIISSIIPSSSIVETSSSSSSLTLVHTSTPLSSVIHTWKEEL